MRDLISREELRLACRRGECGDRLPCTADPNNPQRPARGSTVNPVTLRTTPQKGYCIGVPNPSLDAQLSQISLMVNT